jgi:two-component system, NtrC family, sensor kinase
MDGFTQALASGALLAGVSGAATYAVWRMRAARRMARRKRDLLLQRLAQGEKMAALGEMVAGVAHQLNTPLAFSRSNVILVRERLEKLDSADVPVMREMLGDVLHGLEQMSELVVNMREFTRLDRAAEDDIDLNRALRTVAYMARSMLPERVRLVEDYAPLPPMRANASQLNQVFLNLITNAAQAMPQAGTITVRSREKAGRVMVQVADTGSGIPPDVLPRIFDSFYTTKPRGVGTGLGLSIALDIVRNHGGDMKVDSSVGKGTVFTVSLPGKAAA